MKWTAELTVEFTPVPPEMEEAYWETIRYFARVMFADFDPLVAEYSDVPPNEEHHLGEEEQTAADADEENT